MIVSLENWSTSSICLLPPVFICTVSTWIVLCYTTLPFHTKWTLLPLQFGRPNLPQSCPFFCTELIALNVTNVGPAHTQHVVTSESRHDKTNKMSVRPAKTQISLGIRPVWSESSLSAWRKLGSLVTHWAHSEASDQTGRFPVGFVMSRRIWSESELFAKGLSMER